MKKIAISTLLATVIFISCDSNFDAKDQDVKNNNSLSQRTSTKFGYIESTTIDNGLNSECENNILIFPSLDEYEQTIDLLDDMVDQHCDGFENSSNPNLTDEEYEALSETSGFDEDQPLRDFEEDLAFCSLWSKIYNEETQWLSQQGDGVWNEDEDPDNHFIDEETERVLLNIGSEVMIGDRENGYLIYKFFDWGYITIANNDTQALVDINTTGVVPLDNPNIVVVRDNNQTQLTVCKGNRSYRNKFSTGSKTRIKIVGKTKDFKGEPNALKSSKIKVKTKYYRKKLGVWTRGKTTLTAGVEGEYKRRGYFQDYNECGQPRYLREFKTRKRSKVKYKHKGDAETYFRFEDNKCRGVHKRREDVIKQVDFFNYDVL